MAAIKRASSRTADPAPNRPRTALRLSGLQADFVGFRAS
jgi:hypothetical protein